MRRLLMNRISYRLLAASCWLGIAGGTFVHGEEPATLPRSIPLTRPEMKQYLEDMKARQTRIPLPELTDEDKTKLGERGGGYEGRLRYHFLTGGAQGGGGRGLGGGFGFGGFGRESDSDNSLDYAFKTQLFWIVSRTNNCQYCLGHQESKLLAAGMTEDEIAALDGDWQDLSPQKQAAYAFARKITYQPHHLNDADIVGLRQHFTDKQILEMILSVAGNNSINRWKEGAGIPQSADGGNFGNRRAGGAATAAAEPAPRSAVTAAVHGYLTPTSEKYRTTVTKVAPLTLDSATGKPTKQTLSVRPPLESRAAVEQGLQRAQQRTPRLPLADESKAREMVSEGFPSGQLPQWVRLLATFSNSAAGRIASIRTAEERGDLTPRLKAQVSWIIARQDRAWYATGLAKERLRKLGLSDDQIYQLDGTWAEFTPAERAMFTVARNLATSPVVLTDAQVAEAVKYAGSRDVVQLISYTTNCASFDRITEAAGLQLEK